MTLPDSPMRVDRRRFLHLGGGAALAAPLLLSGPAAAVRGQASDAGIVIANEMEPADLSPWMGGYGQALVTRQIYEPLVEVRMTPVVDDPTKADITFVPMLAESWEQTDELTWRFVLHEDVMFHNDEPFTAEAVKASWDVLGDAELAASLGTFAILAQTTACTVVDPRTVEIATAEPDNELIGQILRLGLVALPPAMLAAEGIAAFSERPVGTGPYRFVAWERGQRIELERNQSYWNAGAASFAGVTFVPRPEAAVRAQTIAAGESDLAYNIGAEQASALARSATGGGFQTTSLRINNAITPTSDQNLRLAINHAIDRMAITESIFLGQARPAAFFGFQPVTLEPYAYDPERARQLVSEGGFEGAELELVYGEGRIPEEDQLAEIYKAFFEDIGLRITLTRLEPVAYNERGGAPFAEQPALYMETTSSGNYGEIAGGLQDKYGTDGTGTFSDPAFDARFAALRALDGDARIAELQSIAEDLHALAPRAWVAVVQQVHGVSERISATLPLNVFLFVDDLAS